MPSINTGQKSWRRKTAPLMLTANSILEHLSEDPAFQLVRSTSGTSKVLHGPAIFPDVSISSLALRQCSPSL